MGIRGNLGFQVGWSLGSVGSCDALALSLRYPCDSTGDVVGRLVVKDHRG